MRSVNSKHRRRGNRQCGGQTVENLESTVRSNRLNHAHLLSTCRNGGGVRGVRRGEEKRREKRKGLIELKKKGEKKLQ